MIRVRVCPSHDQKLSRLARNHFDKTIVTSTILSCYRNVAMKSYIAFTWDTLSPIRTRRNPPHNIAPMYSRKHFSVKVPVTVYNFCSNCTMQINPTTRYDSSIRHEKICRPLTIVSKSCTVYEPALSEITFPPDINKNGGLGRSNFFAVPPG